MAARVGVADGGMGEIVGLDRRRRRQERGITPLYRPKYRRVRRRWRLSERRVRFALLAAVTAAVVAVAIVTSPFSLFDTVRHYLAAPSCNAARAVGLAPSVRGAPGYWPAHDADGDGVACEVYPRGVVVERWW